MEENSYDNTSWFSKIFFNWVNKKVVKLNNKQFKQSMHENVVKKLDMFRKTKDIANNFNTNTSIFKIIYNNFHNKLAIFFAILVLVACTVGQVFIVYSLTDYLSSKDVKDKGVDQNILALYFLAIIITQIVYSLFEILINFYGFTQCVKLRNNFNFRILERSLDVNFDTTELTSRGNIINLVQTDTQQFIDEAYLPIASVTGYLNIIIFFPISFYLLSYFFSFYILSAIFLLIITLLCVKKKALTKLKLFYERDKRINFLTNSISNIRYVKYNVYENFFAKIAHKMRLNEISLIKIFYVYFAGSAILIWIGPTFNIIFTFWVIFSSNSLLITASILMAFQRINEILNNSFMKIPMSFTMYFKYKIFQERIEHFKKAKLKKSIYHNQKFIETSIENKTAIHIDGDFFYKKQEDNFKNFNLKVKNLEIKKGELVFIIGELGSGKSSLVKAMMGDLNQKENSFAKINGTVGYSCQNGFVQSKSLKENIIFYNEFNSEKLQRSIDLAFLKKDVEKFEDGIEKMLGDEGTQISKGQKIRINIARCFYNDSEIFILDDPFSALDMNITDKLMKKTIFQEFSNKTRVIVTHSLQYLGYADRILYVINGELAFNGTYKEFAKKEFTKGLFSKKRKKSTKKRSDSFHSIDTGRNTILKKPKEDIEYYNQDEKKKGRQFLLSFNLVKKYFGGFIFLFLITLGSFIQNFIMYFVTIIIFEMVEKFDEIKDYNNYMYKILILMALPILINILKFLILGYFNCNTSRELHKKMISRTLHANLTTFFDEMDRSFILNRFSNDLTMIDDTYFIVLLLFMDFTAFCILDIVITSFTVSYWTIFSSLFCYICVFFFQNKYIKIQKDIYRLEFKTRTPVLELADNILEGQLYFDVFKKKNNVLFELKEKINENTKNLFLRLGLIGWFDTRISLFNIFLLQVCAFSFILIFFGKGFDPKFLIIFVTYVFSMVTRTKLLMGFLSSLETGVVNLERCETFCNLETEKKYINYNQNEKENDDLFENALGNDLIKKKTNNNKIFTLEEINSKENNLEIFTKGKIEIKNIYAKYHKKIKYTLKNINIILNSGEKLGICGKTGSGKSTLIKVILRHIIEEKGEILIDGYNISKIDLKKLRSEFLVINQDIALFEGTLRENINPEYIKFRDKKNKRKEINELKEPLIMKTENDLVYEDRDEKILIENLIKCGFSEKKLKDIGLDFKVEGGGKNLSAGEKQLISLFKIFFSEKKIIILDEATSNMDFKSEDIFLNLFFERIKNKTLICIAHRVNTLVNFDKVIVLDKGEIIENGNPKILIDDESSNFYKLNEKLQNNH